MLNAMNKRQCSNANFQASLQGIKLKGISESTTSEKVTLSAEQEAKAAKVLQDRVNNGK